LTGAIISPLTHMLAPCFPHDVRPDVRVVDLKQKLCYLIPYLVSDDDKRLATLYTRLRPETLAKLYHSLRLSRPPTGQLPRVPYFDSTWIWDVQKLGERLTEMVVDESVVDGSLRLRPRIVVTQHYIKKVHPCNKIVRYEFNMEKLHMILVDMIECLDENTVRRVIQVASRNNKSHCWYYGVHTVSLIEPRLKPILNMIRLKKLYSDSRTWKNIVKRFPSETITDMKTNPTFGLISPFDRLRYIE
jgi:hypothetical protein